MKPWTPLFSVVFKSNLDSIWIFYIFMYLTKNCRERKKKYWMCIWHSICYKDKSTNARILFTLKNPKLNSVTKEVWILNTNFIRLFMYFVCLIRIGFLACQTVRVFAFYGIYVLGLHMHTPPSPLNTPVGAHKEHKLCRPFSTTFFCTIDLHLNCLRFYYVTLHVHY
jgi:hypothetical protein